MKSETKEVVFKCSSCGYECFNPMHKHAHEPCDGKTEYARNPTCDNPAWLPPKAEVE